MATNYVKVTAVDGMGKLECDNILQKKLDKLHDNNYYENVFSWDMKKVLKNSGINNLELKTIDKFRNSLEKQLRMLTYENGLELFCLHKFYLKLIICYELYTNGQYNESLTEVEDFVKYIKTVTFDKSNGQYIAAYNHMVLSTYAYIMTSINVNNCEEIMKDVKLKSELNDIEKSVIHAVKALVFMEYPSFKHAAFNEANEAYKLHPTDCEWINIWLKAKGPLNRRFDNFEKPDINDLEMAECLLRISKSFWHLITVSDIFLKFYKHTNNAMDKQNYFSKTLKNMSAAIELAGKNEIKIIKCLKMAIDQPVLLLDNPTIEAKLKIIQNFEHPHINGIIGNFYFKQFKQFEDLKDYETAKDYFIRGMKTDVFCVLNMLKIECILKPLNEIPIIQTLVDAYEVFLNSKSRVKLLAQILLYYTYYDGEKEKIIHYFKLFMDQPFDYAFKYRHLYSVIPVFKIEHFNRIQFLKELSNKMEYIIENFVCSSEERKCLNDSYLMFSKMIREASINIHFKKLGLNDDKHSKKWYPNRTSNSDINNDNNWRKQRDCQQPSSSKHIDQKDHHGKYIANKLNWRNQRNSTQNQSQYASEGVLNWRFRQNKDDSSIFKTNGTFGNKLNK